MTRLLIAAMRAIGRLPYRVQAALGNALGALLYLLVVPRRRIALRNLELCFPDWSARERRRVARAHFRAFARTFLDRGMLWFAPRARLERLIRIEGIEHLERNLPAVTGRPLVLLVPHFLGLDAGGMAVAMRTKAVSMYTRQPDPVIDAQLRAGRQRFSGAELYARDDGIRPVVRAMKKGLPFFVLPDMDLGPTDSVFVDFLGVTAATVTVVPRLARLTGARVVPMIATLADDGGGYRVRFFPAWEDYPGEDETAATQRMNDFIAERVRETPAQYYWVHKRFKTRPPGAPSLY